MRKLLLVISIFILLASVVLGVNAHPGRTDGSGGHYNRNTGEYHYHHGYSEHSHYDMDGDGVKDCPYNFKDTTEHKTESNSASKDSKTHNESTKEQQQEPVRSTSNKKIKIDEDIITAIIVALVIIGSWVVWYLFIVKF